MFKLRICFFELLKWKKNKKESHDTYKLYTGSIPRAQLAMNVYKHVNQYYIITKMIIQLLSD